MGVVNNVPAGVTDLAIAATRDTSVTLAWTATGDDSLSGRPAFYELRAAVTPKKLAEAAAQIDRTMGLQSLTGTTGFPATPRTPP